MLISLGLVVGLLYVIGCNYYVASHEASAHRKVLKTKEFRYLTASEILTVWKSFNEGGN